MEWLLAASLKQRPENLQMAYKRLRRKINAVEIALFYKLIEVKPGHNPPKELIRKAGDLALTKCKPTEWAAPHF